MASAPSKPSVEPSLYRRGAVFYAKIRHVEADGRKVWKNYNTREADRNRARDAAEAMQLRADRGLPPIERKEDGQAVPAAALLTVRELIERFLKERDPGTLKDIKEYRRRMASDCNYLIYPYLGAARASTLRRADIKAHLQFLREEKHYGLGTVRLALASLSVVYGWAIDEEILDISGNPCQRIRLAVPQPSEEHYTLEQVQALLALPDCPVMLATALYTGMRRGELRALRWAWVDLEGMVITVRGSYRTSPKNKRPRQVPIHRELLPWLKRWQKECPPTAESLLFPMRDRNGPDGAVRWRMGTRKDDSGIGPALIAAKIEPRPHRPWHAARHSLGTHLAKATRGNLDVVAKILGNGHGSHVASVTMGYVHTADLDYLAGELAKLTYLSRPDAKVLPFKGKEARRHRPPAPAPATDLLPEASDKDFAENSPSVSGRRGH